MSAIYDFKSSLKPMDHYDLFSEIQKAVLLLSDCDREEFEERAAIMEYEGGLSREEAEFRALRIVKNGQFRLAV